MKGFMELSECDLEQVVSGKAARQPARVYYTQPASAASAGSQQQSFGTNAGAACASGG